MALSPCRWAMITSVCRYPSFRWAWAIALIASSIVRSRGASLVIVYIAVVERCPAMAPFGRTGRDAEVLQVLARSGVIRVGIEHDPAQRRQSVHTARLQPIRPKAVRPFGVRQPNATKLHLRGS